ncbi:glycoside hydrolase 3 protein [Agyrium rufum]|nr:glycoside hydrolase 3 protein [Agyrium rufum]
MRTAALLTAAAALPLAVSAAGTLGFALGDKNGDGSCKVTSDYAKDFTALKGSTSLVRMYAASECSSAEQVLPAASSAGFKVVLGVWPDTEASYAADKAALQSALSSTSNAAAVYGITVGSEALYRGSLTAEQLLSNINDIKKTFPGMKVGTADSWNKYQDGTADPLIKGGVTFFMTNAFAYWQGQELTNATHTYLDDIFQAFTHIQNVAGTTDVELWIGETGWPGSGGTNYGAAIAGTQNAATYFQSAVCATLNWDFNVFFFEAFDEPWKPASVGDSGNAEDETHWGAYTVERVAKYATGC